MDVLQKISKIHGLPKNSASPTDTWIVNFKDSPVVGFLKLYLSSSSNLLNHGPAPLELNYESKVYENIVTPLVVNHVSPNFVTFIANGTDISYKQLLSIILNTNMVTALYTRDIDLPKNQRKDNLLCNTLALVKKLRQRRSISQAGDHKCVLPRNIRSSDLKFNFFITRATPQSATTLHDWLKGKTPVKYTTRDFLNVFFQAVSGCYAMSCARLVHQDLHLGNAFVTPHAHSKTFEFNYGYNSYTFKTKWHVQIYDFDRAYSKKLGVNTMLEQGGWYCNTQQQCNIFVPNKDMVLVCVGVYNIQLNGRILDLIANPNYKRQLLAKRNIWGFIRSATKRVFDTWFYDRETILKNVAEFVNITPTLYPQSYSPVNVYTCNPSVFSFEGSIIKPSSAYLQKIPTTSYFSKSENEIATVHPRLTEKRMHSLNWLLTFRKIKNYNGVLHVYVIDSQSSFNAFNYLVKLHNEILSPLVANNISPSFNKFADAKDSAWNLAQLVYFVNMQYQGRGDASIMQKIANITCNIDALVKHTPPEHVFTYVGKPKDPPCAYSRGAIISWLLLLSPPMKEQTLSQWLKTHDLTDANTRDTFYKILLQIVAFCYVLNLRKVMHTQLTVNTIYVNKADTPQTLSFAYGEKTIVFKTSWIVVVDGFDNAYSAVLDATVQRPPQPFVQNKDLVSLLCGMHAYLTIEMLRLLVPESYINETYSNLRPQVCSMIANQFIQHFYDPLQILYNFATYKKWLLNDNTALSDEARLFTCNARMFNSDGTFVNPNNPTLHALTLLQHQLSVDVDPHQVRSQMSKSNFDSSIETMQPGQLNQPIQIDSSIKTVQPGHPDQPIQIDSSIKTMQPGQPDQLDSSVESVQLAQPDQPDQLDSSVESVQLAQPSQPDQLDSSVESVQLAQPSQPDQLDSSVESMQPGHPDQPIQLDSSVESVQLAQPSQPDQLDSSVESVQLAQPSQLDSSSDYGSLPTGILQSSPSELLHEKDLSDESAGFGQAFSQFEPMPLSESIDKNENNNVQLLLDSLTQLHATVAVQHHSLEVIEKELQKTYKTLTETRLKLKTIEEYELEQL